MGKLLDSSDDIIRIVGARYDDVCRICYPLFKKTPIQYYMYQRIYDTGEMLYLGNGPDLLPKWFLGELYPTREELDLFCSFGIKTTIVSHYMPLPLGSEVAREKYENLISTSAECDLFHVLFFVERFTNYYRISGFGMKEDNKAIFNFYINALRLMEEFVGYFEKKANDLITFSPSNDLINLPNYDQRIIVRESTCDQIFNLSAQSLFQDNQMPITLREKECLSLVAQGYTMKNAARKLKISPRTVEQHLRNIKDKYGLNTKNQLVEIWHEIIK